MERMNGLLLCKVVNLPTLEKHHSKDYPEGTQAWRGCSEHMMLKSLPPREGAV